MELTNCLLSSLFSRALFTEVSDFVFEQRQLPFVQTLGVELIAYGSIHRISSVAHQVRVNLWREHVVRNAANPIFVLLEHFVVLFLLVFDEGFSHDVPRFYSVLVVFVCAHNLALERAVNRHD